MAPKPSQSKIAAHLGVSPGRVSQLVKAGMPTFTLEAAAAWKTQHIAPIMTPAKSVVTTAAPRTADKARQPPAGAILADIEAAAERVGQALARGNQYGGAIWTWQLRALLRRAPEPLSPRLSVRAWVALLDYILSGDAELRHCADLDERLTPAEAAARIGEAGSWSDGVLMFEARDWDDNALNGYPDYQDEDDEL